MNAPINIEQFRRLDLRVGTIAAVRRHPEIGDLAIVTILLDGLVDVLALSSLALDKEPGARVIVAAGLHPLVAGGLRFTHCLVGVATGEGKTVSPDVLSEIPNGSRLL